MGHPRVVDMRGWVGRVIVRAFAVGLFTVVCGRAIVMAQAPPGDREAAWKGVTEAMNQRLPQTAIERLDPILQAAIRDGAWGEAAKAIALKVSLETQIQGNKPEEGVLRLQGQLAGAPTEVKPILQTILADRYWQYFLQNRWRFAQRTATATSPGTNFTTWDLRRLFAEIDATFQSALANTRLLQNTPVAAFREVLTPGTMPDRYRPTLYDFVAHQALAFYTAGEQAGAKPEDAFELSADSPIFGPVEAFVDWTPSTGIGDTNCPVIRAIRLYQDLLRFHRGDDDPAAMLDADLGRLAYGKNVAVGDTKTRNYVAALQRFVDRWADHELSALALHEWARQVHEQGDWVKARELASRGQRAFPQSPGGKLCANLVQEIEARSFSVTSERVWNAPWPKLSVRYRNLTQLHFRVVPYDSRDALRGEGDQLGELDEAARRRLLGLTPALTWIATLPVTTNYQFRLEELALPRTLPPGFYYLIASGNADFGETDNQVFIAGQWVSDLALVIRTGSARLDGFVLDARSGEPIAGAEVGAWYRDNQGNRRDLPTGRTDPLGMFDLGPNTDGRAHFYWTRKGDQALSAPDPVWAQPQAEEKVGAQTLFFTDRSLYRPGQIIQYKGICVSLDPGGDTYEPLRQREVTVSLRDANGKEVAQQVHRCNDFGSFSGSFTAPRDRLTGRMMIRTIGAPEGQTWVNVEEYKRPKFQVELEAPAEPPRLNDEVRIKGQATAYTGSAINDSAVTYRVVREVQYPWWVGWWRRGFARRGQPEQEIAHGTGRTDADGRFTIGFKAVPDRAIPEADEPTFHYRVFADVTDSSGETRSAQYSVPVGYTALQVTMGAGDWQTAGRPIGLLLRASSLDGQPQAAEGQVKVHRLNAPATVQRPRLGLGQFQPIDGSDEGEPQDSSSPDAWPLGDVVVTQGFSTGTDGAVTNTFTLPAGAYRVLLETQDRFGKRVTGRLPLLVVDPEAERLSIPIPFLLAAPDWSLEPGQSFEALWGTGYEQGRAFIEIEHRGKTLDRGWTQPGRTQQRIRRAVTEAMRGGFGIRVTQVRENRAYLESRHVDVPWSNKHLELSWEHLNSKLQPGQKETWTAIVRPPKNADGTAGEVLPAEMVATLYDASLDQFLPHHWLSLFGFFRQDAMPGGSLFGNTLTGLNYLWGNWRESYQAVDIRYREFLPELVPPVRSAQMMARYGIARGMMSMEAKGVAIAPSAAGISMEASELAAAPAAALADNAMGADKLQLAEGLGGGAASGDAAPSINLGQVSPRRNLNETAFFFPQLTSDSNGVVRMTFSMPEALTEWRFQGFAHDQALRSGSLTATAVTAKDIMVQPNPPRFLREGDVVEFTVKVSNQSATRQEGRVELTFRHADSGDLADEALGNTQPQLAFDLAAKESRSYAWRIRVPDHIGFLSYRALGSTGRLADGEEGYLPVLSRRVLVRESLPLPIRGPGAREFEFTSLLRSGGSDTLRSQAYVVQMVSHPAWYAVMALPYLMEYPYECSEQTFNRFYANTLAQFIAGSDPKIRRVFDQWRDTPALDSPLERNAELRNVALEETPWVIEAEKESQARRNVGILFDENRLSSEIASVSRKLAEMQLPDGSWPWFPGGRGDNFITLYIATGFGRLRHLGVDQRVDPAVRALNRIDAWTEERYREIQKRPKPEEYVPSSLDALALYGRSFFLADRPVPPRNKAAYDFFVSQARQLWVKTDNRQTQGHIALALQRWGGAENRAAANAILKSLKERSVTDDELGRFWRDTESSWWWYRAPIETQALMIEAFDEIAGDRATVDECQTWLLKQKQTQNWKTTKATADAIYALLLRGRNPLSSDALVEVTVGGTDITPKRPHTNPGASANRPDGESASGSGVEPGTGFYERRFAGAEVKPSLGSITVRKSDPGIAWGGAHWLYLEDISRVKAAVETPLKLQKSLFTRRNTAQGPILDPVQGPVRVGDELVVRIELRVDRDMEYVHLKDQRGSGTEPVGVLSGYRYQDGLGYYESTRDVASHFFIDYLPKGTYVFEYATRVQLRGDYQTGIASIQCLYAPEFNSHSASIPLVVQ